MTDFSNGCLQFIASWCTCESELAWCAENASKGNVFAVTLRKEAIIFFFSICEHYIFFECYSYMDQKSRAGFLCLGTNPLSISPSVCLLSWEHEWRNDFFPPDFFFLQMSSLNIILNIALVQSANTYPFLYLTEVRNGDNIIQLMVNALSQAWFLVDCLQYRPL